MPKKIPTLGEVAQAKAEEKKKAEGLSLLGKAIALLGLGGAKAEAKPDARMSKRTETTKHVVLEEDDSDDMEEESEEEEEMDSETDKPESTDDGSTGSEEEEEEGYAEEEEERAVAKGARVALKAANAAYLASIKGQPNEAALALRSPLRLAREAKKATGAKTVGGAMAKLSRLRTAKADDAAATIKANADLEARLAKIEQGERSREVDALVAQAKLENRAGATTKDGRKALREHGNAYGAAALQKLIAGLPQVARTVAQGPRLPDADAAGNVADFGEGDPREALHAAAVQGLTAEQIEEFEKLNKQISKRRAGANGTPTQGRN